MIILMNDGVTTKRKRVEKLNACYQDVMNYYELL